MNSFEANTWVWLNDEEERYLPAKVVNTFQKGSQGLVMTEDGEEVNISPAQSATLIECNPEALDSSIDDLVNISDLNEMSILHNLRIRYKENKIYTNISSILISVNPFKLLPIYTPAVLDMYRSGYRGKAPHVYGVAYNAYNDMQTESRDQSVVISGESGAGKSEATKLILQFLTDVSVRSTNPDVAPTTMMSNLDLSSNSSKVTSMSSLEQQILAANPILEAFGNAKTLRNNNSSRFGKLITVNFDKTGGIVGGCIINYLLEKSRVVVQTQGERNYHIFYQLLTLANTDPVLNEELKLQAPEMFQYTGLSGVTHIDGVSDEKDLEDVKNSFNILNFSREEVLQIFRIVAGVLHFGNAKFRVEKKLTEEDGCAISNPEIIQLASKLWSVDPALLEKFLCARNIGTRDVILVNYTLNQALDARDAMVKRVYAELFQWIVNKINTVLSTGLPRQNFIGVLDIFGFESFEVNTFEQLCINFCNEKLQYHFNEHIFKMEQALYQTEGIVLPGSSFVDNQPTLDLLEARVTGIFSMIDEEISVPKGSDEGMLQKIFAKHGDGKHTNLIRPKAKDCKDFLKNFGILHYAGPVYYNVTNFLEKNRDQLHPDIVNVLKGSRSELLQKMFPTEVEDTSSSSKSGPARGGGKAAPPSKPKTLGGQFKNQLNDLINTLNSTYPHFVRCMKPNDDKVGNLFKASRMQDQLRYAGLVEVCRIRKLGFPVRRPFDEFYSRYRCIDLGVSDWRALLEVLQTKGILTAGEWAVGNSRIFLRTGQAFDLESARETALYSVAIVLQKNARRYLMVRKYKNFKKILRSLRDAVSSRDEASLTSSIEMSSELPFRGTHLRILPEAKALLIRVREEKRIVHLLESALASGELNNLRGAVAAHAAMKPPMETPLVDRCQEVIARLEAEIAVKDGLGAAIAARSLTQLTEFINKALEMKYTCPELHQAQNLKARIEKENALLVRLVEATKQRQLEPLTALISECVELGLERRMEIKNAEQVKADILAEMAERAAEEERQRKEREAAAARRAQVLQDARNQLIAASKSRNINELTSAIENAIEVDMETSEVELSKAQTLRDRLRLVESVYSELVAAMNVVDQTNSDAGVTEQDLNRLQNALNHAKQRSVTVEECPELTQAEACFENYSKQLDAKKGLQEAIRSRNREALLLAIDKAENLSVNLDVLTQAKELHKQLELEIREQRMQAASTVPPAPSDAQKKAAAMPPTPGTPAQTTSTSASTAAASSAAPSASKPAPQPLPQQEETYDAAEQARQKRQEIARQNKYEVKNFQNLRSLDDFARGAILNKTKVKESFLVFQASPIPKSLTDINKDLSKLALQIHKELLGYMGDKQMPFPAMLAQDILRKGFEHKQLRDEIYLQIIKQLNGNSRPESIAKGWQMMCMCVGTFSPSYEFENYLLHFILDKRDRGRGAIVDYAKYCLRTLEAMLNNGDGSGFVPSVEEILAYKERPPILASIYLVDGSLITEDLPITPDLNAGKILEMCIGWLDLKDERVNSLGIFVYDLGDMDESRRAENTGGEHEAMLRELQRSARPLRNEDFMGDVIVQKARQRRKFKFVLKKKIFLQSHNYRGDDPLFDRLVYIQAEDDAIIQGIVEVTDKNDVAIMTAISMCIAFNEELGQDPEHIVDQGVMDFVVPAWKSFRKPEEWAKAVAHYRNEMLSQDQGDLQEAFLDIMYKCPSYGTHWFHVCKAPVSANQVLPPSILHLPRTLYLGFNSEGLHFCDLRRKVLLTYCYADIFRWGGSSTQFSLIMADEAVPDSFELMLITAQAADMAAIILDYIRAIMAEQEEQEQQEG